ncbi:unnamed protein product [Urochloa humidicola]
MVGQDCDIVKQQLALADGIEVCGSSKLEDLCADSWDTGVDMFRKRVGFLKFKADQETKTQGLGSLGATKRTTTHVTLAMAPWLN